MKKSYAASIILGPFLIIGYLFFILYPIANYIEEKGVPKWVYELLHYEESDEEEEDND